MTSFTHAVQVNHIDNNSKKRRHPWYTTVETINDKKFVKFDSIIPQVVNFCGGNVAWLKTLVQARQDATTQLQLGEVLDADGGDLPSRLVGKRIFGDAKQNFQASAGG